MRDIIFRAKRTDNGEWVQGCLWNNECDGATSILTPGNPVAHHVDPDTVCEWTGLTDRNSVKIFEGDVVSGPDFDKDDGYAKIRWDSDDAKFVISGFGVYADFDYYYGNEFEVIGNIYDNPDLIYR